MTTAITVDAHAGWPVEVKSVRGEPQTEPKQLVTEIVPANEKRTFYIHSGLTIVSICEMPRE